MKILSTLFISLMLLLSINVTAQKCKTDKILINTDASTPGVAMHGYDILSYFDHKPAKGNPSISSIHQGVTYIFVSESHKQKFDANPEKYLPAYGGFCAVAASFDKVEELQQYDIYEVINGKLYFNKNKKAAAFWKKNPKKVIRKSNRKWDCLVYKHGVTKSSSYTQPPATDGIIK